MVTCGGHKHFYLYGHFIGMSYPFDKYLFDLSVTNNIPKGNAIPTIGAMQLLM